MCELHNLGPTVYIDFDPTITQHGLVFKNEDRHLLPSARNPTIVYDYTPFWHAKNSYFPVFLDTLQHQNIAARQEVMDEAQFDESFSLQRILRQYWINICANDGHDACLRPGDIPDHEHGADDFTTESTTFIQQHGRGIDSWVWDHYLAIPKGMATISNAWKELLKRYQLEIVHVSVVRGVKR
ncbi:hypothetical protein O0I10_011510 [Lichtheimia ornata]|uniref:Uncharacterized protein n=1 Tax=Lichtheimia ornata TaxID=688661 RepID=A0AAD7XU20_9FUNG|nr:uncharacterized protein O0I10_011510 [Lichtheimia ornata]KAJ8652836.1 hypothetical protein O0I10_011510 [Lichtheimia ornata]